MDMKPIDLTTIPHLDPDVREAARSTVACYTTEGEDRDEILAMLGLS